MQGHAVLLQTQPGILFITRQGQTAHHILLCLLRNFKARSGFFHSWRPGSLPGHATQGCTFAAGLGKAVMIDGGIQPQQGLARTELTPLRTKKPYRA